MASPRTPLVRLFCIACALVVLPLVPVAMATVGTMRRPPLPLEGSRILTGGAIVARDGTVIEEIRFGNAPPVAAGSPEARRRFRNVPPGTAIAYELRGGRVVSGQVENVPADTATLIRRLVLTLLTVVMALGGLALGLAGRNAAALYAGGFLSGAGTTLGFVLLEPTLVTIASTAWRDAIIVAYSIVPAALWCRYLLLLAAELPTALPIGRGARIVIGGVTLAAVVRAALSSLAQIAPLLDRLPAAITTPLLRLLESAILQIVPYLLAAVLAAVFLVRQLRAVRRRQAGSDSLRRARLVAWGFAAGLGVPLIGISVQFVSLLSVRRLALPREAMALLLLPLILVPLSLTVGLLSRRIDRVGVVVQRALVFAIADRTLAVFAFLPLAVLVLVLYRNRHQTIGALVAARLPLLTVLAIVAVAGLFYASAIRRALERLFFRGRADSRRILRDLVAHVREATDVASLERRLAEEIDRALHVEAVALFSHDRARGLLQESSNALTPLDADSTIARLAAQREALDLDSTLLATLTVVERQWAEQRRFHLIVPLHGPGAELLGLIALGEKMSGLPYDAEDRLLLGAVGTAAALALDNLRLRAVPSLPAADTGASDAARLCPACDAIFEPLAARCDRDAVPLVPADVPHILHGKFRFERRVGAGAMGLVYRASDLVLQRGVAIKTLPELAPDAVVRFEREARAVAALSHPAIATIHAAEVWRGRPMLVFELLEGGTLQEKIARGPLPAEEVVSLGVAVADALVHAHAAGILHRDIKPANIGFGRNGAVKVLDFGLARFIGDTASAVRGTAATSRASSGIAGTPCYLSPEAVVGKASAPLDDLWSVAVTLYEALTTVNPFEASTVWLTMNRILSLEVPDPRLYRAGIPPALAELLLRALHRQPAERIGSAAELRDALRGTVAVS